MPEKRTIWPQQIVSRRKAILLRHDPAWCPYKAACTLVSGGIFFRTARHRRPGQDWLAQLCLPAAIRRNGGRHLFRTARHRRPGRDWLALLAFPLPAGGDQEERAGIFLGLRGIAGRAGLARTARRSPACRRRSGGAAAERGRRIFFRTARLHWPGRDWLARLAFPLPAGGDPTIWGSGGATGGIFFRTAPHRRPGGIGSRGSPFPCLPAASGGAAGGIFFGIRGIVRRGGIGSRGSPFPCLPAAIRRYSRQASFFGLRGIAGRDGIGSHCSPFPCLPAASLQEPEMPKGYFFILACSFG